VLSNAAPIFGGYVDSEVNTSTWMKAYSDVFYHSAALQSETATVEDALFGFYRWLDDHPSEAIFFSF